MKELRQGVGVQGGPLNLGLRVKGLGFNLGGLWAK